MGTTESGLFAGALFTIGVILALMGWEMGDMWCCFTGVALLVAAPYLFVMTTRGQK